jgi:hypothetical protein
MRLLSPLIAAFSVFAYGAQAQAVDVEAKPSGKLDYSLAQQLTTGPAYGFSDGKVRGKYLKLVVLEGQLAYDPPTLRIEHFTYGDEGCCKRLVKAKAIDTNKAFSEIAGQYIPESEGFTDVRWLSPTSVELKYNKLRFVLSSLDKAVIKVQHENR